MHLPSLRKRYTFPTFFLDLNGQSAISSDSKQIEKRLMAQTIHTNQVCMGSKRNVCANNNTKRTKTTNYNLSFIYKANTKCNMPKT